MITSSRTPCSLYFSGVSSSHRGRISRVETSQDAKKINKKLIILPPVENRVIDVSNIIRNTCLIITCRGKSCFFRLSGTFSQFSQYQFNNLHFMLILFTFLRTFLSMSHHFCRSNPRAESGKFPRFGAPRIFYLGISEGWQCKSKSARMIFCNLHSIV